MALTGGVGLHGCPRVSRLHGLGLSLGLSFREILVWLVCFTRMPSSTLIPFLGAFRFPYKPLAKKGTLFKPRLLGSLVYWSYRITS